MKPKLLQFIMVMMHLNLDAIELVDYINRYYDCEVELVNGNQPNYHFLIGFE
nr:hypothetical protein [Mycoplasmopsis bovis]